MPHHLQRLYVVKVVNTFECEGVPLFSSLLPPMVKLYMVMEAVIMVIGVTDPWWWSGCVYQHWACYYCS